MHLTPVTPPDTRTRTGTGTGTLPPWPRRAGGVAWLGLVGVAGLMLMPPPVDLAARLPEWSPWARQGLLALNPALLVIAAAILGATLAHRTGLRSLAAGTAARAGWGMVLATSAAAGLALGVALAAVDALLLDRMGDAGQRLAAPPAPGVAAAAGAMLYGGLAEEVMLRWGVMSLAAWGLSVATRRHHPSLAMAGAVVIAAGLFAAGHLPALAAQAEPTLPLVARTLLLNGVAGLCYGWLFWRHHLEAAMTAHAATHLGLWAWRAWVA